LSPLNLIIHSGAYLSASYLHISPCHSPTSAMKIVHRRIVDLLLLISSWPSQSQKLI